MLKKIPVDQVCIGMYLHELCGPWIAHPFWQKRFVLRDAAQLARLRQSAVLECVIDASRGLDVATPAAPALQPSSTLPALAPAPVDAARPQAPVQTATLAEESRRAALLVNRSRDAVQSLFNEARMGRSLQTDACVEVVSEIAASVWRHPDAMVGLTRLKQHDDYTYMHSVSVCALMVALARQLGMAETEARDAGVAGLLHDLGKAAMPLEILNKPGKLTDAEFEIIRSHPLRGHEWLSAGDAVPEAALDVCLHHHERPDGAGYPHGLAGEAIGLYARMGAVCDVYDAITSDRPYKAGWDPAESIARMASWRKGQFDEPVFQAFVQSVGIYPTGSLVRLHSGRLGVVTEQNAGALVAPKVRVFFSTRSNLPVPAEVLDLASRGCADRIVGRESNADWKFPHLEELWVDADVLKKMRASMA